MTIRSLSLVSARRVIGWLILAALAALSLFFACTSEGSAPQDEPHTVVTPTPSSAFTVVIADIGDASLADRVRAAAERAAATTGAAISFDAGGGPRVTVSHDGAGADTEAPVRWWALFAGFWSEIDGSDASTITAVYYPVEHRAGIADLAEPSGGRAVWLPLAEIPERLATEPRAAALLPLDAVPPGLRSLGVPELEPNAERLYLSWEDNSADAFGEALARELTAPEEPVTRVVFTGDIIPARCVYQRQRDKGDFTAAFAVVGDYLRAADLTVGSLDASISDAGEPEGCYETLSLLAPPETVEGLQFAGIDIMAVAANHIKDCGTRGFCGEEPFVDTLENLRAAGIQPSGGGLDRAAAHTPVVVEVNGIRFAFLAYDDVSPGFTGAGENTPGTAALSAESLVTDIEAAAAAADVVIIEPQWGNEYTPNPSERQRELARIAIDAGADLIVGNHPHTVQAVGWYDGVFTAYALGNFVYDQDWSLETQQGMVLEATFWGSRVVGLKLRPVHIVDMHQPAWADPAEAKSILDRVRTASEAIAD
jgi:poly-gamma-glutamate synthesis protein (capsule biosynthesis protein)